MPILSNILSVYALYAFTVAVVVLRGQKRDKFPALMMGIFLPVISLVAFVHVLFRARATEVMPCPRGLEEAEALVERKRQIMFNTAPIEPTIAKKWRRGYAASIELQARRVRKFSIHLKEMFATV